MNRPLALALLATLPLPADAPALVALRRLVFTNNDPRTTNRVRPASPRPVQKPGAPAMAFVDPKSLTAAQAAALARLAGRAVYRRRPGGWGCAGQADVPLKTGRSLVALGLAREDYGCGRPALFLTYSGRTLAAVIEQRKERIKA